MKRALIGLLVVLLASACSGNGASVATGSKETFCEDWDRFNAAFVDARIETRSDVDRLVRSLEEITYSESTEDDAAELIDGFAAVVEQLDAEQAESISELTPKQQDEATKHVRPALDAGAAIADYHHAECSPAGGSEDNTAELIRPSGNRLVNDYARALAKSMAAEESLSFSERERLCLASETVAALGGASTLADAGVTPDDLAKGKDLTALNLDIGEEEAQAMAASFGNCDVSLAELVLAEAGGDVPAEVRACVEENLDEEMLADFFAQVLVDDEASTEPPEALLEPLMACF